MATSVADLTMLCVRFLLVILAITTSMELETGNGQILTQIPSGDFSYDLKQTHAGILKKGIVQHPVGRSDRLVVWPSSAHAAPQQFSSETGIGASRKLPSDHGKRNRKCCQNGGLCVLGAFCHCPEGFHGRRCQHARRPCGPVLHGKWLDEKCPLCKCFDGVFSCLPDVMGIGCGNRTEPIKEIRISFLEEEVIEEEIIDVAGGERSSVITENNKIKKVNELIHQLGISVKELSSKAPNAKMPNSFLLLGLTFVLIIHVFNI
ncbi:hypothetical protein CAPTEDRAFT_215436 [Capitella teleta]|uniref:EGF-like domain-containing protein n=1 Tax=Capitella teleta TaxID=283909 RepID=R7TZP6_CAPTE|nr:hypothetical protein CAPTEDRAFT_215436 [Capitella teleta]|eukprot:ELT99107.1 hypothetical protein CAPTEDRAFT_215436 [Capitella teleta]